jgi:hypothetical protein
MKKGYVIFAISIIMALALLLVGSVSAVICSNGVDSPSGCVCGHYPDSSQGFGQVQINGNSISCDNIADGVCPERFMDPATGLVGNCGSCPDPDCRGTVAGIAYSTAGMSNRLDKVTITSHPIRWNPSANLENSIQTGPNGDYSGSFITGRYYFSASKDAYDTLLTEVDVTLDGTTTQNFQLTNGTCHADCTNSYGRCNAACDGMNVSGGTCHFYDSNVAALCEDRLKGTEVYLGVNSTNPEYGIFITCCGDSTSQIHLPDGTTQNNTPYSKYYTLATTDSGNMKNLIKIEKIAKYNDVPVRLIVAYWQP